MKKIKFLFFTLLFCFSTSNGDLLMILLKLLENTLNTICLSEKFVLLDRQIVTLKE